MTDPSDAEFTVVTYADDETEERAISREQALAELTELAATDPFIAEALRSAMGSA